MFAFYLASIEVQYNRVSVLFVFEARRKLLDIRMEARYQKKVCVFSLVLEKPSPSCVVLLIPRDISSPDA